ncbi:hypothetical protein ACFQS1_26550 [Paractinoplanes rhizophilus]|uniref:Uncharacterized protein n=1 Tax=Paractinoplanes rhizophilus TaxID=1416877 RepID=A0ABW2HWT8_9ACTN
MSAALRLSRWLVVRAARRWPGDMSREWLAELEVLRAEPAKALSFALSLAVSPAVEALGQEPVARVESWARSLAASIGVPLLAAMLFNGVHLAQHHAGPAGGAAALAAAATLMAALARRISGHIVVMGATTFAFLLAGNRIQYMPYMGWADILPAVAVWTMGTLISARLRRLPAIAGTLITLELATIAGSLHAAIRLGIDLRSAAAWFPLSLAPGGAVTFGPAFPGYQASELLLGNASAMAGPMLLCSIFVLARSVPARSAESRTRRVTFEIPLGVGATLAAQTACEMFRRLPPAVAPDRLIDNTGVFGFGFAAHLPGQILIALIAGLLAAQLGALRRV